MPRKVLPPAINGLEQRLDALTDAVYELVDLMTPAKPEAPKDGGAVELREPKVVKRNEPRKQERSVEDVLPKGVVKKSKARSV